MGEQPIADLIEAEFAGEWGEDSASHGLYECRVLRATNLASNGIDYSTAAQRFVPLSKVNGKQLIRGDIILEAAGGGPGVPVGRVARFDPPDEEWAYLVSNFFRTLRPAPIADSRFVYHLLHDLYRQPRIWQVQQQTTGIINLKVQDYLQLRVPVPPLGEQRRIAEVLDTIDETIQGTERLIAKRRTILIGLQTSLLKENSTSSWVTVGDLVSHHWPGEWGEEARRTPSDALWEVLVLRATNFEDYGIDYSTGARRFVTDSKVTDKRLVDGDILIEAAGGGPSMPVGRARRFRQPPGEMPYLTSNFFRTLRPKVGVNPDYLFWLLDNEYRKPSIWSCQQQTTGIINLKVRDYLERPVSYDRGSQLTIAQALNSALGAVEVECQQLKKLQETRDGLAADLLSGRVRTVAA